MAAVQPIESMSARARKRESCAIPRLEQGDHLIRAEFERRYEAMPDVKKAELVEGVVYMPSPAGHPHARTHSLIATWAGVYATGTPGIEGLDSASVLLEEDSEFQPDILVRRIQGGSSRVTAKQYIEGPPELVTEVAVSSASYDLHEKMRVYRCAGVSEYLVWRVQDEAIGWWALESGVYTPLRTDRASIVRSRAFPGLWLARKAMLAGDMATVLSTLQEGMGSPEHAAFVASLAAD